MSPSRYVELVAYAGDVLVVRYRRRIRGAFRIAADRMTRNVLYRFPAVNRVSVELLPDR